MVSYDTTAQISEINQHLQIPIINNQTNINRIDQPTSSIDTNSQVVKKIQSESKKQTQSLYKNRITSTNIIFQSYSSQTPIDTKTNTGSPRSNFRWASIRKR